ncbi:MAG: hypothetical protein IMX00_09530 [Limnochordales bacterium]|nr:hypothetical protein [Limnochordales bacterium]
MLSPEGGGEGVAGGAQDCYEDLSPADLAGLWVEHLHGVPRKVYEQFLATAVYLAHGDVQVLGKLPVELTKLAILQPVRMLVLILPPEEA